MRFDCHHIDELVHGWSRCFCRLQSACFLILLTINVRSLDVEFILYCWRSVYRKMLVDRFHVVSTLWHFDYVIIFPFNGTIHSMTLIVYVEIHIWEHIEHSLANLDTRYSKQHEMCEAITHNVDNNSTCNIDAENERVRKRLWFFLCGLFIFIVIAWLHRLNWIEPIERELWQRHATIFSTHQMWT